LIHFYKRKCAVKPVEDVASQVGQVDSSERHRQKLLHLPPPLGQESQAEARGGRGGGTCRTRGGTMGRFCP